MRKMTKNNNLRKTLCVAAMAMVVFMNVMTISTTVDTEDDYGVMPIEDIIHKPNIEA